MNILLIGPQGSGKGTQARILTEKYGFYYFESGAYLRKIAENNSELRESLAQGNLVPDKEMTSYLTAFLDEKNLYDNIIFDGFPRTLEQYKFFKNWLSDKSVSLDLVIDLTISEKETLKRLLLRKRIEGRGDDNPEAIKKRLALFRGRTQPLISELKKETKVVEIDGERPIEIIASDIDKFIK